MVQESSKLEKENDSESRKVKSLFPLCKIFAIFDPLNQTSKIVTWKKNVFFLNTLWLNNIA